ncbi:unnamed protein product [Orchesella dallaii]|uniref:Angiotensin-converting enzyme n=1 Tax=Orchesella dallaii TaxID=48710 RepID=A0ABP1QRI9_9HEXA
MKSLVHLILFSILLSVAISQCEELNSERKNNNEKEAKDFLRVYNEKILKLWNDQDIVDWNYRTNVTKENSDANIAAGLVLSQFIAAAFEIASQFDTTNFSTDTTRQLIKVGRKSLSDEEMKNLTSIISQMGQIYGEGKVCRNSSTGEEECLRLGALFDILSDSRNISELLWAWEGWRMNVGRKIKPLYFQYVDLKNKLARVNGQKDYGEVMRQAYETPSLETDIRNLYEEMKPLYMELHAYVRRKLYDTYGPDAVDINGTIPQHLTGHMWGRFWTNLYSIAVPFPKRPSLDMTEALNAQNYTVRRMFEKADEFYQSMGLLPLPPTFYNLSMFERPPDRQVMCHPVASDFHDGKDFRVRLCISVEYINFLTVHHELGHIQYYMQYANQPGVYR